MFRRRAFLFAVLGAVSLVQPVWAEPVDLELVLAIDVSASIDKQEAALQRAGTIAAITDPKVIKTIQSGLLGKIAVAYIEWAGTDRVTLIADWAVISDAASAKAFAARVAKAPLDVNLFTSISFALGYAAEKFDGNGFEGTRRVIDISSDGPNNQGVFVDKMRDRIVKAGITINGLPIVNDKPGRYGWPPYAQLAEYYEDCVIGGQGAFLVVADTHKDFARAIKRKMLLEIAGRVPAPSAKIWRAARKRRAKIRCDIGELRLEQYDYFGDQ